MSQSIKALIISDNHGNRERMKRVLEMTKPLDCLIHAGDLEGSLGDLRLMAECPVHIVRGNNDSFLDAPREDIFPFGKHTIYLTHGHRDHVDWTLEEVWEKGRENGAQVVVFGHTHVPYMEYREGIWLLNPGSIGRPRGENGKPGFLLLEQDPYGELHVTQNFLK